MGNEQPLVSVVMPAYNAEKYIAEAVNSVLAQTYSHWELIIVDDGSVDATAGIVKQQAAQDNRIKYWYQENGKQGKARNKGIKHASGELIAFLDADDLWLPNKLTQQVQELQRQNVDLVFSKGDIIYEAHVEDKSWQNLETIVGRCDGIETLSVMLISNKVPIQSVLTKKSCLLTVDSFDERLIIQNCEDYHLWLKLLNAGYIFYGMEEKLFKYRRHNDSSTANRIKWLPIELQVIKEFASSSSILQSKREKKLKLLYRELINLQINQNNMTSVKYYLKDFCSVLSDHVTFTVLSLALRLNTKVFRSLLFRMLT